MIGCCDGRFADQKSLLTVDRSQCEKFQAAVVDAVAAAVADDAVVAAVADDVAVSYLVADAAVSHKALRP